MQLSDEEWAKRLTSEQYSVLREKGTEIPGSGALLHNTKTGVYTCAACDSPLFGSESKYESTIPGLIGWPSFSTAVTQNAVILQDDTSQGMHRTEVICRTCGSHLGHLFDDDSSPNGKHYCINSLSLEFEPKSRKAAKSNG